MRPDFKEYQKCNLIEIYFLFSMKLFIFFIINSTHLSYLIHLIFVNYCMTHTNNYYNKTHVSEEASSTTTTTTTPVSAINISTKLTTSTRPQIVTISLKPTSSKGRSRPTRPALPTTIRGDVDIIKLSDRVDRTKRPVRGSSTTIRHPTIVESSTVSPIVLAGHPQDNEIAGSSNIQLQEGPDANVPFSVDGERKEVPPYGARLNPGAVIALGAFGGFIFLAAIITTIVVLVRR